MSRHTFGETLGALRHVATSNSTATNRKNEYIERDAKGRPTGRPECIVGHVLERMDLFDADELDGIGSVETHLGYFHAELGLDENAIDLLIGVQRAADVGEPPRSWGEIVGATERSQREKPLGCLGYIVGALYMWWMLWVSALVFAGACLVSWWLS